jgi:hypothetical protein
MATRKEPREELGKRLLRFVKGVRFWTILTIAVGIITAIFYASSTFSATSFCGRFAVLLAILAASFLVGAVVGLLFAFPNYESGTKTPNSGGTYRPSTKLAEVADWVTKTLVGLSLTQLAFIPRYIRVSSEWLGHGIVGSLAAPNAASAAAVIAGVTGVFGLFLGFLSGFLLFRVLLPSLLLQADADDRDLLLGKMDKIKPRGPEETPVTDLNPADRKKVKAAAKVDFRSLTSTDDMLRWAKAKIGTKKYRAARMAYEQVLNREPNNVQAIIDYVDMLAERFDDHTRALEVIRNTLSKSTTITAEQALRLKRDEVFNLLWINLDEAIRCGEDYLKRNQHTRVATHLIYAYAGKYVAGVDEAEKRRLEERIRSLLKQIPSDSHWRDVMREDINDDMLLRNLKGQEWFEKELGP